MSFPIAAILLAAPAAAHEYNVGPLHSGHPWARATPKGATVGGGYLSVTNNGKETDRFIGGESPVATSFELHKMTMDHGVMKMRPVNGGIAIAPGETVTLTPGGLHVMLVGLKEPLKQGTRVPATLDFAKAGKVQVEFVVEGIGATHEQHGASMPEMQH
jgi:copper(I)-binding protein